ncbi:MAG: lipoprotein-releasing ABC transporter permease subunit [Steroidobacteraceae bacterium]
MTQSLAAWIGLRYVRSRRRSFFVSFITWVSLAGVCVGTAALVVILSVMNGFEAELRARLLALAGHAAVTGPEGAMRDWPRLVAAARSVPGVRRAEPELELEGLMSAGTQLAPVRLRGVPAGDAASDTLRRLVIAGDPAVLRGRGLLLGAGLAQLLGVRPGDAVTVLLPRTDSGGAMVPRIEVLEVGGVIEAGISDHDTVLALGSLAEVSRLAGGRPPALLRLEYDDVFAAPERTRAVLARLGPGFEGRDWTVEHRNYFHAIRIEKTMMTLILLLIVAVAAFNIVASLYMVVSDKRRDIAILRTLGLEPGAVARVFLTQGAVIGWLGALAGVGLGLLLATHIDTVVPFIENVLGFQIFDADVYYISRIPAEVHGGDVAIVALAALALTLAACVYPAVRAARVSPAEALRYE